MPVMRAMIVEDTDTPVRRSGTVWVLAAARPSPVSPTLAPVIGWAGADPSGTRLFAAGQAPDELAPLPPGASARAVALRVSGHSMRGLAEDGALIFFEDQRTPPAADMLGHVVVVETDGDEVLVKRLLKGSRPGVFDLESLDAPFRSDVRLRWAAHITAIIPPFRARRILVSAVCAEQGSGGDVASAVGPRGEF